MPSVYLSRLEDFLQQVKILSFIPIYTSHILTNLQSQKEGKGKTEIQRHITEMNISVYGTMVAEWDFTEGDWLLMVCQHSCKHMKCSPLWQIFNIVSFVSISFFGIIFSEISLQWKGGIKFPRKCLLSLDLWATLRQNRSENTYLDEDDW